MKIILAISMIILLLCGPSFADGLCDSIDLLAGEQRDPELAVSEVIDFRSDELPKDMAAFLNRQAEGHLPDVVSGVRIDLNGDGVLEYFLSTERMGGGHNMPFYLFAATGGGWTMIGDFLGLPVAILRTGTNHDNHYWREMATYYRVRQDYYGMQILAYNGFTYKAARGRICEDGVVK